MGLIKGVHQKLEPQQSPAFFVRGASPFARLVFFSALALTFMAVDSRLNYLAKVRLSLVAVVQPLELLANMPSDWYRDFTTYFSSHNSLLKENALLKAQTFQQSITLQRLATVEAENNHLRSLLSANPAPKQISTLGEIIHMGRDPFAHKVVVNRGSAQGIVAGQAVVDAAGVIGQVTRVYPYSSEVTLIIDKGLSIPIQIERNNLRAIAFGQGRDSTLDLPYLPANVDIIKGDKLVTSGIDGVYPAGLAIAVVVKIERKPDSPFAHIICTPLAGVNNHKQVLLLSITPEAVAVPIAIKPINSARLTLKDTAIGNAVAEPSSHRTNEKNNTHPLTTTKQNTNPHLSMANTSIKSGVAKPIAPPASQTSNPINEPIQLVAPIEVKLPHAPSA